MLTTNRQISRPRHGISATGIASIIAFSLIATFGPQLQAEKIILHLKNGDRVGGELLSENEKETVVNTPWAKELRIPNDQIENKERLAAKAQPETPSPETASATNKPAEVAQSAPPAPPPPKPAPPAPKKKDEWKFNTKIGADMIRGERDRDIYYGQLELTYAHPYESNPKKFFRNKLDYRIDYGTTDGNESANRMFASDKTDFDFAKYGYAYNYVGGGYDKVRRIDSQIEGGPGAGYHLFREANFVLNIEGGLTYQYQDRENASELDAVYARLGQDCTWKVYPKITFTQRSSMLASLQDSDQLQFRLEANLSFGIVQNLSFNLTAIELYDTRPVPGVTRNEFQLRSALGITF